MNQTAISWTDLTWNLFSGCTPISPECARCYAQTLAEDKRGTRAFPHGFGLTVRPHRAERKDGPAGIAKPTLIFTNSMSDPGLSDDELIAGDRPGGPHEGAVDRLAALGFADMDAVRDLFFDTIEAAPRHRYQVLTKRPEELLAYLRRRGRRVPACAWMGVTIGSAHHSSTRRLAALRRFRDVGAAVLFVSAEPLLDDLRLDLRGVDWIITGGESGRHFWDLPNRFLVDSLPPEERAADIRAARRDGSPRRPIYRPREDRVDWIRRLRDAADRAGCAHFFKQWGPRRPHARRHARTRPRRDAGGLLA